MENNKIRIAITQGDINGVSYETIFKTFSEPEMFDICTPIIYGSQKAADYHSRLFDNPCQQPITISNAKDAAEGKVNILPIDSDDINIELGSTTETSAKAAIKSLDAALADNGKNVFDAIVCAPMNIDRFTVGSVHFPGITPYIADRLGMQDHIQEIFINDAARLAYVHIAADTQTDGIDPDLLTAKIKALHTSLRRDFRISNPRIAVLQQQPVSDSALYTIIANALKALAEDGIQAFGPYHAQPFFDENSHAAFDALLALCPAENRKKPCILTDYDNTILLTGMPRVVTLPDTNAQTEIAGQGIADEAMLRKAIYTAVDTVRYRREYDEPMANPLQKLYRERPDSGEKLRFAITKKKDE